MLKLDRIKNDTAGFLDLPMSRALKKNKLSNLYYCLKLAQKFSPAWPHVFRFLMTTLGEFNQFLEKKIYGKQTCT